MQGEFPLMLFALPAACLAMYHEAHTKNKKSRPVFSSLPR